MYKIITSISFLSCVMILVSCGGSGGGEQPTLPPVPKVVLANDDLVSDINGSVDNANVLNVLSNDSIDGSAATNSNTTIQITSASDFLILNDDGSVDVKATNATGIYTLDYSLCESGNNSNCNSATVSVDVFINEIVANNDNVGDVNSIGGTVAVLNVLDNDTLNGEPATSDLVEVTPVVTGPLSLNSDGSVDVANGALAGSYSLDYEICEVGTENCSSAAVEVTVVVQIGIFMKGNVSGLKYATETISGYTSENGEFYYLPDESIRFFIGSTQLGQAIEAQSELGPMSLFPGVKLPETAIETKHFFRNIQKGIYDGKVELQVQLINVLALLYTLDNDKTHTNGVSIKEGVDEIFTGMSVNLNWNIGTFLKWQGLLRIKLFEAYNDGLIDSAKVFNPWEALENFYSYKQIIPQVYIKNKQNEDYTADGIFDFEKIYLFDDKGALSSFENSDGYKKDFSFDEAGEYIGSFDHASSTNAGVTIEKNIHGQDELVKLDNDGDGIIDSQWVHTYDDLGRLVTKQFEGDGTFDNYYKFEFLDNGLSYTEYFDIDNDGVWEDITVYQYDDSGNLTARKDDNDADGNLDFIITYSYNDNNHRILSESDSGADGTIDRYTEYTVNEYGYRTSSKSYNSGNLSWQSKTVRDEFNREVLVESDWDGDGQNDEKYVYEYSDDEFHNVTSSSFDWNGDAIYDSINNYEYDANGALTLDADPRNKFYYTNDEHGNPIMQESEYRNSGIISRRVTYEYQQLNFLSWYTNIYSFSL